MNHDRERHTSDASARATWSAGSPAKSYSSSSPDPSLSPAMSSEGVSAVSSSDWPCSRRAAWLIFLPSCGVIRWGCVGLRKRDCRTYQHGGDSHPCRNLEQMRGEEWLVRKEHGVTDGTPFWVWLWLRLDFDERCSPKSVDLLCRLRFELSNSHHV